MVFLKIYLVIYFILMTFRTFYIFMHQIFFILIVLKCDTTDVNKTANYV